MIAETTKERPILFSGAMVRAIIEGRKTQTRRVVKPQPPFGPHRCSYVSSSFAAADSDGACTCRELRCPYGGIGDRLWVRETWAETESDGGPVVAYRAGGHMIHGGTGDRRAGTWRDEVFSGEAGEVYPPEKWKPSIHIPRWAARITLEIESVRMERVAAISEADAKAEGIESEWLDMSISFRNYERKDGWFNDWGVESTDDFAYVQTDEIAQRSFQSLWDSINAEREGGKYAWAANPWVWVIGFRRVNAKEGQ